MWIIDQIKKHYAKKAIAKRMPRILKKNFGKHKRYTKKQIDKAITSVGIDCRYAGYAYAMYMSRAEFNKIKHESSDYDAFRFEIGNSYFGGNSDFTIHDAIDNSSHSSGIFGGSDGFDSGGDCSGGDSDQ